MAKFGHHGTSAVSFVEESIEVIGATLLLIGVLEYLIARSAPIGESTTPSAGRNYYRAVWIGATAPLLLVPLAGLGTLIAPEIRTIFTDAGYHFSAARIAYHMETVQGQGNVLVAAPTCDVPTLQALFPYELRTAGSLDAYPPANTRAFSPPNVLTVVTLNHETPTDRIESDLERVAMRSTRVWFLQCGTKSDADEVAATWLTQHATSVERLQLPGSPAVTLTQVTPQIPPMAIRERYHSVEDATFGNGEVSLIGYNWELDRTSAESEVLRVTLLWEAHRALGTSYHVFVHLLDGDRTLVSQSDGVPVYDRYPFDAWQAGEVIPDWYDLALPPNLSLEQSELIVGLYDFETDERVLVGSLDHVVLDMMLKEVGPSGVDR